MANFAGYVRRAAQACRSGRCSRVGGTPRELHDDELFQALPTSFSIFRVYSKDHRHDAALHAAVNSVLGAVADSKTNM